MILNADRLSNKLEKICNIDLTNPLNECCIIVENTAKELCPVDTGILRMSITHEVENNIGVVGTNTEYAPYVEIGTGLFSSQGTGRQTKWCYKTADNEWHTTIGQHPQPFLHPALTVNKKTIQTKMQEEYKKELKKYVIR